jgi:hypothetical protein
MWGIFHHAYAKDALLDTFVNESKFVRQEITALQQIPYLT